MARSRLMVIAAAIVVCGARTAGAQSTSTLLTGYATIHLGQASGGDIRDKSWTPGGSMSVIESNGFGAEVDLSHTRQFDNARFLDSSITSFMINVAGVWGGPAGMFRPYGLAGIGLMRARVCANDCAVAGSHTEVGIDGGAGLYVFFNDVIGVRGDVRYFRYLQRHPELPRRDNGIFDFWRMSIGATLAWDIR